MKLILLALSFLVPILLSTLSTTYSPPESYYTLLGASNGPLNVLLLTAHPDDECMFFAPTLLALTRRSLEVTSDLNAELSEEGRTTPHFNVYSLCLSSGNADGLGKIRKQELAKSLDVLGIPEGRRWVLDEPFEDNITDTWNTSLIAEYVHLYVLENDINIILTFDKHGISSHPNHISLAHGAKLLVTNAVEETPRRYLRAFSLVTVPTLPKYIGQLSAIFKNMEIRVCELLKYKEGLDVSFGITNWCSSRLESSFVSSYRGYMTALKAMMQHRSQLVWFRWLYVTFSRYLWVNDWLEILPDTI